MLRQKRLVLFLTLTIIAMVVCSGILPVFIRNFVDAIVYKSQTEDYLLKNAFLLLGLFVFNFGLSLFYEIKFIKFSAKLEADILYDMTQKIIHTPYITLSKYNTGDLYNRIAIDARVFYEVINNLFFVWFKNILYLIAYFCLLFYFIGWYSLLIWLVIPVIIAIYVNFDKRVGNKSENYSAKQSELYSLFKRITSNIKFIKSNNSSAAFSSIIKGKIDHFSELRKNIYRAEACAIQSYKLIELLAYIFILFMGLYFIYQGKTTIGTLMGVLSFITQFIASTRTYADYFTKFRRTQGYFDRLMETWDFQDERQLNKGKQSLETINSISINAIKFSYDEKTVLNCNSQITLEKGKKYALIGKTGSGKSTFTSILLKLLPVPDNTVLFNSTDSNQIDTNALYEKTGILLQEDYLFDMPLIDNIVLGEEHLKPRVTQIVENFGLESFLADLEGGLEKEIINNGANLSGGQRRIVSLLRILVRNPEIIILDEVTNGMDSKLKERFFDFIEQIHPDRIILFITHDFSNIDWFHEVLFIHDAKILAGNHDHLINENSNYRKMFTKQAESN